MFSLRTRFWLMAIVTVLMAFFTYSSFASGSYGWGILMLIFTYFNYEQTFRLYKAIGGVRVAIGTKTTTAFHETRKFDELD